MKRNTAILLALSALLLVTVVACSPKVTGRLDAFNKDKKVKVLYVWDADGHTDLSLLRGLKDETARQLAAGGYVVSTNPNATGAYVKITVDDAVPGDDGYIRARLYIVDSTDPVIVYDKTCEARSGGEGYPIASFVGCALSEFVSGARGE